jgi:hypothetical protein
MGLVFYYLYFSIVLFKEVYIDNLIYNLTIDKIKAKSLTYFCCITLIILACFFIILT